MTLLKASGLLVCSARGAGGESWASGTEAAPKDFCLWIKAGDEGSCSMPQDAQLWNETKPPDDLHGHPEPYIYCTHSSNPKAQQPAIFKGLKQGILQSALSTRSLIWCFPPHLTRLWLSRSECAESTIPAETPRQQFILKTQGYFWLPGPSLALIWHSNVSFLKGTLGCKLWHIKVINLKKNEREFLWTLELVKLWIPAALHFNLLMAK